MKFLIVYFQDKKIFNIEIECQNIYEAFKYCQKRNLKVLNIIELGNW